MCFWGFAECTWHSVKLLIPVVEDRRDCLDCKVIPGECVVPQRKLVVADFRLRVRVHRDKHAEIARTKWWKLRGEAAQTFKEMMLGEGPWEEGEDAMICV